MSAKSFKFKPLKAIQAVGLLLDSERSKQMPYYRVLKLLYIADREYLGETGRPITGGHCVAMDQGPLSSAVYDLVKKTHPDYAEWSKYFRTEGRNLDMHSNPGNGELSKREIRKLLEVATKLADRDDDEIGTLTHEFAEYERNHRKGTSTPIPIADIIDSVGRSAEKEAILEDAKRMSAIDSLLGG